MAKKINETLEFFENTDNLMSFGSSFALLNGQPLEKGSIFASKTAAETYAASASAYVGKQVVVVENGKVTAYLIANDDSLQEVGSKPIGDLKSIDVAEDGTISIHGYGTAGDATLPQKQADGTIKWVAVSAIVEGDGNTKTLADGTSITATYDEPNDTYTITIKGAADAVNAGKILSTDGAGNVSWVNRYDDTALAARVTTNENNIKVINDKYIKSIAFDEATSKFTFKVNTVETGSEAPVEKDVIVDLNLASVIKSFDYDADAKQLILKDAEWEESMTPEEKAKHETRVDVSALVNIYEGSKGNTIDVTVTGNKIAAEVKAGKIGEIQLAQTIKDNINKGVEAHTAVTDLNTGLNTKASQTDLTALTNRVTNIDKENGEIDQLKAKDIEQDGLLAGLRIDVDTKQTETQVNALISGATITQTQVDGLDTALKGKVDKNGTDRLMTEEEGTQLADLVSKKPAEAGAQVNKIETIKTGDQTLAITDPKTINIPTAMAASLGLVKGSDAENKINVEADGTMSVNTLNVNKLAQTAGDELILNGGNASGTNPANSEN